MIVIASSPVQYAEGEEKLKDAVYVRHITDSETLPK